MIPNVVEQVKDVEINPLILGGGEFPLWTFMLKPHGDAILPDDKQYLNWRNSQTRLLTEGTSRIFKMRYRVLLRKYESNKETAKLYSLTCVVLHIHCIEGGDLVLRRFCLTSDPPSNKRLSPEEVRDTLTLQSTNQKNFEVNKKSQE